MNADDIIRTLCADDTDADLSAAESRDLSQALAVAQTNGMGMVIGAIEFERGKRSAHPDLELLAKLYAAGWRIADDGDPYKPEDS